MRFDLSTNEGVSAALLAVQEAHAGGGHAPTDEQLRIIRHSGGPALVLAGAGAGKTAVMAQRVVYQVLTGAVEPDEILGLTFTRKAANELAGRVASLLRAAGTVEGLDFDGTRAVLARPTVTTYNAFASSIAGDHGLMVGVDPDSRIITDGERYQIVRDLLLGWDSHPFEDVAASTVIEAALALSAALKDNGRSVDDLRAYYADFEEHLDGLMRLNAAADKPAKAPPASHALGKLARRWPARLAVLNLVEQFSEYKAEHRLIEFADQVHTARRVLEINPAVAAQIRERYGLVLLDEYQDTSVSQAAFLARLFGDGHDIVAVGDPHQAIYGWRGASADALDHFRHAFSGGRPMPVYQLVTAFRNSANILEAANEVVEPLRAKSQLPMAKLHPVTSGGRVDVIYELLRADVYPIIADDIAAYRKARPGSSMAVLCRSRAAFDLIIPELERRGIDHIAYGTGAATAYPEALTIRGLLRAVIDPARADGLLRVLTLLAIAPADIAELHRLVRQRSGDLPESLVDALGRLDEGNFSREGERRLGMLASWMRELTAARYARLDDIVSLAIRLTRLDVEVASRSRAGGLGRAGLDALARMAAGFAEQVERADLGAFLDWLDMVDAYEKSGEGDLPLASLAEDLPGIPDEELTRPNKVTVMTVHGAKGLEWDYVAIPELSEKGFAPKVGAKSAADHWSTELGVLPTELREDRAGLEHWRWRESQTLAEYRKDYDSFVIRHTEHANAEVLRLGYVAFTRPRHRLLLAGHMFTSISGALQAAKRMERNLAAGKPAAVPAPSPLIPRDLRPGRPEPEELLARLGLLTEVGQQAEKAVYPGDVDRGKAEPVRAAAARVADAPQLGWEGFDEGPSWLVDLASDAQALLDTREEKALAVDHLTANDLVSAAEDAEAFRRRRLRPVPEASGPAARLGQQVHEYIAKSFAQARSYELIDVDEVDQVVGVDLDDPATARLIERFESSEFASLDPVAIEEPVEIVLSGVPIRGVIDAVFPEGSGVRIVDWKTGRRPGSAGLDERAVQLQLYRRAWSELTGLDPELIGASFYFLGEDDPVLRRVDIPMDRRDLAELVEMVMGSPQAGVSDAGGGQA